MIVIICTDCSQEQHRVSNGNRPDYEVRLPCVDAGCPRRKQPAAGVLPDASIATPRDRDEQMAMQHMKELASV